MTRSLSYLLIPPTLSTEALSALIAAHAPAAIRLAPCEEDEAAQACARLLPPAQQAGIAFLLTDRVELAGRLGCDGVHLTRGGAAAARRLLGDDLQIGVSCGLSLDMAMREGERGADYVGFGLPDDPALTLISAWSEMMEVPVVAECATRAEAEAAGAEFVLVTDPA